MRTIAIGLAALAIVSGCSGKQADTYTLYRSSMIDPTERVHWATFDSDNSPPYNLNNCQMAARLLNANYRASAAAEDKPPDPHLGFWCEPGAYSAKGVIPSHFEAAYPTDVY